MLKRIVLLIIAVIVGVFIVRTWRFEHAAMLTEDLGQYFRDRVEVDEHFLNGTRIKSFAIPSGTLESALNQFSKATGVQIVLVPGETLPMGRGLETPCPAMEFKDESLAIVFRSIVDAAGLNEIDLFGQRRWRVRHHTIVFRGAAVRDADLVWRSYPVGDLMEICRAAKIDPGTIADCLYPYPRNDEEKFISVLQHSTWQDMVFRRQGGKSLFYNWTLERLNGDMLEVHTTLEEHILLYDQLQELRQQWKADPASVGQRLRTPPPGFRW